jgi:mono/diheme cytochrome c family protein
MRNSVRGLIAATTLAVLSGVIAGQTPKPDMRGTDSKEAVSRGVAVYKGHCAICHYAASTEKKIGPGLKNLSKRTRFIDGTKIDAQSLTRVIQNGGKNMPPLRDELTDAQIRDLLAYMRTL